MADALLSAAARGDVAAMVTCLADGAAVNTSDLWGQTPLHWAAGRGSDACCRVLLRAGADVDAACHAGWTPLHVAAFVGSVGCTAQLLAAGAGADAKTTKFGYTPADVARMNDHPGVACILRDAAARWRGLRRAALAAWCCL